MWNRDRKIRELRLQKLEAQARLYEARLAILECEHAYGPSEGSVKSLSSDHAGFIHCTNVPVFVMKCAKCGKVLRDLTEKEYLVACLERDESSFLGMSNEMKKRLAVLEAEDES